MASRNLGDLQAHVRRAAEVLLAAAEASGLELLITCTLRSDREQAMLFRQGRSLEAIQARAEELRVRWGRPDLAELLLAVGPQHGPRVTCAGPGQSLHTYGLALDAVVLRQGKPVWGVTRPEDLALWRMYGELGRKAGLEWAGDWRRMREYPHLQDPAGRWRELILVS